jgi:hypothetical protein
MQVSWGSLVTSGILNLLKIVKKNKKVKNFEIKEISV